MSDNYPYGTAPDGTPYAMPVPPQTSRPGIDTTGNGKVDYYVKHPLPNKAAQVRHLNQYTGYFESSEGDFPVSVVASSIKEAAKILTMPGVFGEDVTEPIMIKYVKGSVVVSVPITRIGFNTVIEPAGAVDSGAYATPTHAEVENGTEVIFTAYEPFGWKFKGWYKGDMTNGTLLSTSKVATLDVYDPYSTLVTYTAGYEFEPSLRNGSYLDVNRGIQYQLQFGGYSNYEGRLVINVSSVEDYYFVITDIETIDEASGKVKITCAVDNNIVQPIDDGTFEFTVEPSYVGLTLVGAENLPYVDTLAATGWKANATINLKYVD